MGVGGPKHVLTDPGHRTRVGDPTGEEFFVHSHSLPMRLAPGYECSISFESLRAVPRPRCVSDSRR